MFISGSGVSALFLLGLFMHVLLEEIILQPNYTVIMEIRGSVLVCAECLCVCETCCVRYFVC